MTIWKWKFRKIPDPQEMNRFLDDLTPMLAKNKFSLVGADGKYPVDLNKVEHARVTCLEIECNGNPGADTFTFPGFFPGDDEGDLNTCDTGGMPYGNFVQGVLEEAELVFDMELTSNIHQTYNQKIAAHA